MYNEYVTLSNGVKIPQLGLGTWLIDDDKCSEVVKKAVEIGYRHIDTAQVYKNERGVGEGIRISGIPRELQSIRIMKKQWRVSMRRLKR